MNSESIKSSLIPVSEDNILRSLGVPTDKSDDYLKAMIRELRLHCMEICTPCASYSVFGNPQFNPDDGLMNLEGKTFQLNKMITTSLLKSTAIAIFIGTCGDQVEQYSKQLMREGHALEGFIADIIGSEIAEGVADYIHKRIEKDQASTGVNTTNRYSPGYCGWPVSDQQQLFSLMGGSMCGIHLTNSSLMVPIKSVSGIVGLGKEVENSGYACDICEVDQCLYRNKKKDTA
jgi:hypothetical protein